MITLCNVVDNHVSSDRRTVELMTAKSVRDRTGQCRASTALTRLTYTARANRALRIGHIGSAMHCHQRHIQISWDFGCIQTDVGRQTILGVVYQTLVACQAYSQHAAATHTLAETHGVNDNAAVCNTGVIQNFVLTSQCIQFNLHITDCH